MRIPDYHVHTCYSPDSKMLHSEAVMAALQAGISDICFTEHMDLGHHLDSFNRIPSFHDMQTSMLSLQDKHPEIQIRYGLEAGYIPETAAQTAQILRHQPFDYVILSTHCVDGLDCYLPESKRGRNKATAYQRYLETLLQSVTDPLLANSYDCVGHIGYIAKCKHYEDNALPYALFPELFDAILSSVIRNGKGIEVNTSGLKRAGHVLPHPSIISRYHELGGRIMTIGSDAHKPNQVGAHIPQTLRLLRECGFHEIALYTQHTPAFFSID